MIPFFCDVGFREGVEPDNSGTPHGRLVSQVDASSGLLYGIEGETMDTMRLRCRMTPSLSVYSSGRSGRRGGFKSSSERLAMRKIAMAKKREKAAAEKRGPSSGFEDVNLSKVPHSEQDHVQIVGRAESDSTNVTTLTA